MNHNELDEMMDPAEVQALYDRAMELMDTDDMEGADVCAAQLLEQAAEQGHREAAYHLGYCYHHGCGVEKDLKTAYQLYLRSALQGYGKGFNMVGDFYAEGICVRKNYREAIKWYLDATVNEDQTAVAYAEYRLAGFLANGCGVEQDEEQAAQWYEKALSHGERRAKTELARLGYFDTFRIRPCRTDDAEQINRLNQTVLGYPAQENMAEQLQQLLNNPEHRIYLAVFNGMAAGYVHGCDYHRLPGKPAKRVAAMAVEQPGKGMEQALLEKLSQWAAESGCELIACRENHVDVQNFDWNGLFGR